ncbi:recombinase family protein [Kitasatospora sp. NPDC057904]|uniref:recombinase family protein n=1 Tax=Kitasatospora sp. NPDC057904 TaxID=3346275 RepID=UPI0036DCFDA6
MNASIWLRYPAQHPDGPGSRPVPVALYALSNGLLRPNLQLGDCSNLAVARGWRPVQEFWDVGPRPGDVRVDLGEQWARALKQAECGLVKGLVVHRLQAVVLDPAGLRRLEDWASDFNTFIHFFHAEPFGSAHHQIGRVPQKVGA